jgi:hypothetical protein
LAPQRRYGKCAPLGACLLVGAMLGALASPAAAVPVPYHNCGKPADILQISSLDASVWPPPTAAPLAGFATFDPATGQLTNLRVRLTYGVNWVFDSGSVSTSLGLGFVPLPASVSMSATSPTLPVAIGPTSGTQTFQSAAGSVTVASKGNVGQSIVAPLTQLSIKFNGSSGFPVPPKAGSYEARVQMALPGGAEVFCFDLTLNNIAFVTGAAAPIPTLPTHRLSALLLLVAGITLLAVRPWRSLRS